ncbi:AHH domain-containing protein [Dyella nitratireducens]|uniref:Uncharacterized protein n=1 Tax=Dyella nitratireducens TaxID=1849580 RepID=A0ABQ1FK00_9GAMM|nr:AHH domain-containing protein [Dyella nitratireducens]GGA17108.1 hypothetical protein GCM10010981_01040 [Dyella nitratireducens]GLQ44835.1 hypothetical protein GCM10007902_46850 [Dyella nitratireducens]
MSSPQSSAGNAANQSTPITAQTRAQANKRVKGSLSYELENRLSQQEERERVCYQNGYTLPPRVKEQFMAALLADVVSRRNGGHSRLLHHNMTEAGDVRPEATAKKNVATHHIVASGDEEAAGSRELLFGWGIGINDADNGVYLPRYKKSEVPGLPNAVKHAGLHTTVYHYQVFRRLDRAAQVHATDDKVGRTALKTIKKELVAGIFPY